MSNVAAAGPIGFEWKQLRAAARPYRTPIVVVLLALLVATAALAGTWWGHHQAGTRQVTGLAYSTPYQIGTTVDGWTYGIPVSVPWYDANGSFHEDGRPACLPPSTRMLPVTFGYAPVSHDATTWREVVWVDCHR